MVPNYAYGQDAGKAFQEYFKQIVPGGQILTQQEPPFDEKDFSKYINAMLDPAAQKGFAANMGSLPTTDDAELTGPAASGTLLDRCPRLTA